MDLAEFLALDAENLEDVLAGFLAHQPRQTQFRQSKCNCVQKSVPAYKLSRQCRILPKNMRQKGNCRSSPGSEKH